MHTRYAQGFPWHFSEWNRIELYSFEYLQESYMKHEDVRHYYLCLHLCLLCLFLDLQYFLILCHSIYYLCLLYHCLYHYSIINTLTFHSLNWTLVCSAVSLNLSNSSFVIFRLPLDPKVALFTKKVTIFIPYQPSDFIHPTSFSHISFAKLINYFEIQWTVITITTLAARKTGQHLLLVQYHHLYGVS